MLITRLPGESATKTAIRDAMTDDQLAAAAKSTQQGYGPWSRSELLQADLIDLAKWTIYAIYASQGGKPKQPQPYPRPGVTPKKKTQALSAEGHAYLQRLRDNQGASPSPAAPDVPAIEPPGGVAEGA